MTNGDPRREDLPHHGEHNHHPCGRRRLAGKRGSVRRPLLLYTYAYAYSIRDPRPHTVLRGPHVTAPFVGPCNKQQVQAQLRLNFRIE